MALITCTECGKEYSDKASACINCGCPTEVNVSPPQQESKQTEEESNLASNSYELPPLPHQEDRNSLESTEEEEPTKEAKARSVFVLVSIVLVAMTIGISNLENSRVRKNAEQANTFTHPLLESGARVPEGIKENPESINQLTNIISMYGYKCNTVSGIVEMSFTRGFSVWCNNHSYAYHIKDKGGNWVVTLQ
ncbi:zinc ribbon domain-containing protein [Vibrio parahaemolyticus]|uniref:zinc ribbon domain-containing protein n=2 Tax=Vibrio parahaemolyticus TaxID=670 RepID=UPI00046F1604|nr:zinc ribbon domain-containing protein [Vibrio parahaemolyticus]MDF5276966.1 zinc ribbon domain-containing protein [Vibrio parahaemolyticus]